MLLFTCMFTINKLSFNYNFIWNNVIWVIGNLSIVLWVKICYIFNSNIIIKLWHDWIFFCFYKITNKIKINRIMILNINMIQIKFVGLEKFRFVSYCKWKLISFLSYSSIGLLLNVIYNTNVEVLANYIRTF